MKTVEAAKALVSKVSYTGQNLLLKITQKSCEWILITFLGNDNGLNILLCYVVLFYYCLYTVYTLSPI